MCLYVKKEKARQGAVRTCGYSGGERAKGGSRGMGKRQID